MHSRTLAPFVLAMGLLLVPLWLSLPGGPETSNRHDGLPAGTEASGDAGMTLVMPAAGTGGILGSVIPSAAGFRIPGLSPGAGGVTLNAGTRRRVVRRTTPARRNDRRARRGVGLGVGIGLGGAVGGIGTAAKGADSSMGERLRVLELVNQARQANGLMPLTWNDSLAQAAQVRAEELNTNFSHNRPQGGDFKTILPQFGINASAWGENIAQGQPDAGSVMQSWMNSKGHRGNILDGNFGQMGVGAYQGPKGVNWVQLFIR
ncbi:MAG: CAP domain-containing protein [Deltaproteobacteria bacterium]|jgi:hypothetical protein|nr:CAP domain-containing protein [Deltaproteobacteria bacterium]